MKTGTHLMILAGLLLTLPCLAATHHRGLRNNYPLGSPTFDHDPMSITVGQETTTPPEIYRDRFGRLHFRRRAEKLFLPTAGHGHDNIAAASSGTDITYLPIKINLATDDAQPQAHAITIECFKDIDRNNGTYKLKKLTAGTDFTVDQTSNTTGDTEPRVLTFRRSVLLKKNGRYRDHQKVLIVASIPDNQADNGTEDCFQVVTVYDKSAFRLRRLSKSTSYRSYRRLHQPRAKIKP